MKLKKILGITGVAIASVALLAACSSKSSKEALNLQVLKKQLTLPLLGQQHRSHMKKTVN